MKNIENYKKRFYNLMESTMGDVRPINEVTDTYDGIEFKDYVVGSSTPTSDNIDTSLLRDVQKASEISGVKVVVTTAVTGHKKGTRHEHGFAVDIAMVYDDKGKPQGFSGGVNSAKKSGIYDKIIKFVSALESLGYKKNIGEKDVQKAVLTFGYPGHDNHIHVSNVENKGKQQTSVSPVKKPIVKKTEPTMTLGGQILKQPAGDPYEYKKTKDGRYYTKKKTSDKWIDITGTKFEEPIKRKVFKEI